MSSTGLPSEEQRRAYVQYMGATTHAGQQYFYPAAPTATYGTAAPPPAPTPPAAVTMPSNLQPSPGYFAVKPSYVPTAPAPSAAPAYAFARPAIPHRSSSMDVVYRNFHYASEHPRPVMTIDDPAPLHPPPPTTSAPPGPVAVLHCHTCSQCGRMRSAGFHRENPVIPGRPLIIGVCRRCKKKNKAAGQDSYCYRKITHKKTCTAEEPCDWPSRHTGLVIPSCSHEHRGRRRERSYSSDRDELVLVRARSSSRIPFGCSRGESRTRVELRLLQRSSSHSPPRVMPKKSLLGIEARSPSPPPRRILRVGFASPSPPPRTVIRRLSIARSLSRTPSPPSVRIERYVSAEERIATHPNAYRAVQSRPASPVAGRSPSQVRSGILKNAEQTMETVHRRYQETRRSQESTFVEPGGHKVSFAPSASARGNQSTAENSDDYWEIMRHHTRYADGGSSSDEFPNAGDRNRRVSAGFRYYEGKTPASDPPPSPPTRGMEGLRIRHVSRNRARHSTNPHPYPSSPSSRSRQSRPSENFSSPSSRDIPYVPSQTIREPLRSQSRNQRSLDEFTESDITEQLNHEVDIRRWRGIDTNGRPATFVEERRTVYVPDEKDKDSENNGSGGSGNGRDRLNRRMPGSWRDV